jgi:hypothetical protein
MTASGQVSSPFGAWGHEHSLPRLATRFRNRQRFLETSTLTCGNPGQRVGNTCLRLPGARARQEQPGAGGPGARACGDSE